MLNLSDNIFTSDLILFFIKSSNVPAYLMQLNGEFTEQVDKKKTPIVIIENHIFIGCHTLCNNAKIIELANSIDD
jgi:hypothetical protein